MRLERAMGETCRDGDLGDTHILETPFAKQPAGGLQQGLAVTGALGLGNFHGRTRFNFPCGLRRGLTLIMMTIIDIIMIAIMINKGKAS
jgi:hypothetical protein